MFSEVTGGVRSGSVCHAQVITFLYEAISGLSLEIAISGGSPGNYFKLSLKITISRDNFENAMF